MGNNFHGSDLERIEREYGIRKEEIVRFGANVNPLGLSEKFKTALAEKLDVITSYPDREYNRLREVIAAYCGTRKEYVLVGNGSTDLLSLITRHCRPGKVLVLGPAYSEYEREIRLAGKDCVCFLTREEEDFTVDENRLINMLNTEISLLILCNPNNPTAFAIGRKQMRRILDACQAQEILVMVDETYVEFAPEYEQTTSVPLTDLYDQLVIIRGVSKFFAAPGLRLGYAVTQNRELIRMVSEKQNPWTVSSLADIAGQFLFSDNDHIQKTRELIGRERTRIWQALHETEGIKAYPPMANFVLVRILKDGRTASGLFEMAIRRGLMIRDCSSFFAPEQTYFRFCFMLPQDNDRLLACIREFME